MSIIVWKPEFSVNIKILDEQHKKLIDTINMLDEALQEGRGRDILSKIFNNLMEYVGTHFSTEEEFFTLYNYPEFEEHKREHDKCKEKVMEFKKNAERNKITVPMELSIFLVDWLHSHLLDIDKKYSAFLNAKGVQ